MKEKIYNLLEKKDHSKLFFNYRQNFSAKGLLCFIQRI